jgi:hypothetical protein
MHLSRQQHPIAFFSGRRRERRAGKGAITFFSSSMTSLESILFVIQESSLSFILEIGISAEASKA